MAEHRLIRDSAGVVIGRIVQVSSLDEPQPSEVDRLRAVVQALEEEVAAREEDGTRLAAAAEPFIMPSRFRDGGWTDEQRQLVHAARDHHVLVARFAPGAPNPPPDPVQGQPEALRGESGEPGAHG